MYNCFTILDNIWSYPDKEDIYWGIQYCENGTNTAILFNQNGYNKFLKLLDKDGFLLADIQNNQCWSKEKYPSKYPCAIQIHHHFEGSMTYVDIKYKYELYVSEISNYDGYLCIKLDDKKLFYGIEQGDNNVKKWVEINKKLFQELLTRCDKFIL